MLNVIWLLLIILAVVIGAINGKTPDVVTAVTDYAEIAFQLALGLTGVMALWLGLMKVAEESGLVQLLSKMIRPILIRLFPDVPPDHPAMGSITLNIAANMLGLNNAATPLGLRAMDDLEKLNETPGTATNAMCTFLAINTSSVQLIPATAIAYLAAGGSDNPTEIIATTLLATSFSTVAAIIGVKFLEKLPIFQIKTEETK